MKITETIIPGCFVLEIFKSDDVRGSFTKTFNSDLFGENGLATNFVEEYFSYSLHGVIRGLHFQVPPMDNTKLVYCAQGKVMDAVLDLRLGSPSYRKFFVVELSAERGNVLYIPPGLAHGFAVTSSNAVMIYNVTSVYSTECDKGILWDSADIPWPFADPIVSERDRSFEILDEFESPFHYTI